MVSNLKLCISVSIAKLTAKKFIQECHLKIRDSEQFVVNIDACAAYFQRSAFRRSSEGKEVTIHDGSCDHQIEESTGNAFLFIYYYYYYY